MSSSKVLHSAKKYTRRKWHVVPIPHKEKAPRVKGWQKLRLDECDLAEHFDEDSNIGVLLGEASNGLVDVDLDCDQAIFLAPALLPETQRIHGRKSKPESHYWYRVKPIPASHKFSDVDGTCLVELRSTGLQTVVPPSCHPSGERIRWRIKGHTGRVKDATLQSAVKRLAAATLIARHWPKEGSRHETTLALAGTLLRSGWEEYEVANLVSLIARVGGDEEWKTRSADVHTTRKRLDKDAHATGRPRLAELLGDVVVDRFCDWMGISRVATNVATLHSVKAEWPEPLKDAAYHGLAGDFLQAVGPITEADVAGLLLQFLICFGNAIGREAYFRVGSAEHYANISGVLVGRTSKARKGTSLAEVERLFEKADTVWAGRCLFPGGLASGEGLVWAVRDATEKTVKPKKGSKQDGDMTVTVDEGVQDKRLLVIETEFGAPLRIIRREGNILSAVIRRAWDKGNLGNLSKHLPARATGAHISIIGHVTREELLREFNASDGNNGFANRLLWTCVRRSQFLPLGGRLSDDTMRVLVAHLQEALAFSRRTGELRFSKRAQDKWCRVYPKLSDEFPGLLGAITSRAEAQVLRLAMIYALLDRSRIIAKAHLRAALAVWRYCEDSARYIFGDKFGDIVVDTILRRLRSNGKGLTRTEIREVFSRNRTEADIENALRVLQEHHLAHCVTEDTGGRPAERWKATR